MNQCVVGLRPKSTMPALNINLIDDNEQSFKDKWKNMQINIITHK
jgi:hypothetical protein